MKGASKKTNSVRTRSKHLAFDDGICMDSGSNGSLASPQLGFDAGCNESYDR